jgi:hypothetical protein
LNKKTLHIISLEIPFPPDRGMVMSIYYKIKAFYEQGVEVILHAFYKEFKAPEELTAICKAIYLYPRHPMWDIKNLSLPLYMQSRRSDQLVAMLSKDDAPVLFEGLHTLYHIHDPGIAHKRRYVCMHNIESEYYMQLTRYEPNAFKKIYFSIESRLSKYAEKNILPGLNGIFCLSAAEAQQLLSLNKQTFWIPPCIDQEINCKPGLGAYALYHGDLSVKENELGARFLSEEIFKNLEIPLIIAGYKPTSSLKNKLRQHALVTLIESPSMQVMDQLIEDAQVILAPFRHSTGYKMKLLQSISKGRHIITSNIAQSYTELNDVVHFADNPDEWKHALLELNHKPFTEADIEKRKLLIDTVFNNRNQADRMVEIMFN